VLITRVHGWASDKVLTQRFNQVNEFEELPYESGATILKFFLHISNNGRRERLGWVTKGSSRDAVPSLLFLFGLCCGDDLAPAWDRALPLRPFGLILPRPLPWYSALPVGMFYAARVIAGKLMFSIDTVF
jgi:hypothetical protein